MLPIFFCILHQGLCFNLKVENLVAMWKFDQMDMGFDESGNGNSITFGAQVQHSTDNPYGAAQLGKRVCLDYFFIHKICCYFFMVIIAISVVESTR